MALLGIVVLSSLILPPGLLAALAAIFIVLLQIKYGFNVIAAMAEGEFQASSQLRKAAGVLASEPVAVQLRYFQTLTEVASDKSSTLVFPLPIDLLKGWLGAKAEESGQKPPASGELGVESGG